MLINYDLTDKMLIGPSPQCTRLATGVIIKFTGHVLWSETRHAETAHFDEVARILMRKLSQNAAFKKRVLPEPAELHVIGESLIQIQRERAAVHTVRCQLLGDAPPSMSALQVALSMSLELRLKYSDCFIAAESKVMNDAKCNSALFMAYSSIGLLLLLRMKRALFAIQLVDALYKWLSHIVLPRMACAHGDSRDKAQALAKGNRLETASRKA